MQKPTAIKGNQRCDVLLLSSDAEGSPHGDMRGHDIRGACDSN